MMRHLETGYVPGVRSGQYETRTRTTFHADVQFVCVPTDRIQDILGDGPPLEKDHKNKKRVSGLNLLRPKSSQGRPRNRSITQPPIPFSPNSPPAPPLPLSGTLRHAPNNDDGLRHPHESGIEDHEYINEWEHLQASHTHNLYTSYQPRAPLSMVQSVDSSSVGPSVLGRPRSDPGAEAKWKDGTAKVFIKGEGLEEEGVLDIFVEGDVQPIISHLIAAAGQGSGHGRYEHDGPRCFVPWAISDVQLVHRSVFPGKFALSIRIRGQPGALPNTPVSSTTPTMTSRKKTNRLGSAATLAGAFGFRTRGKTISGEESRNVKEDTPFDIYELTHGPNSPRPLGTPPSLAPSTKTLSPIHVDDYAHIYSDKTVYLGFATDKERQEFFAVFRSFCGLRTLEEPTTYRRLSVSIYDLIESLPDNSKRSNDHENDGMTEKWSKMSRGDTHATTGYINDGSILAKPGKYLKAGWTHRERLCIEVVRDGVLIGRTGWTKAAENALPFWGETLSFTDLTSSSSCSLTVYRQAKNGVLLLATVDLPLVSDFARVRDERYPVRSIVDGAVVGELRLSVTFQEVQTLPILSYRVIELVTPKYIDVLYHLDNAGHIEGCYDTLAKIGLATGTIYPLLAHMSDREAQSSDRTLFRGNTPLSKLLESVMRLICHDFLTESIGKTIERIAACPNMPGRVLTGVDTRNELELARITKLVAACSEDLYAARQFLPESLQECFRSLVWSVKRHHPDTAELYLPYKSISSFVFLRLINPAIMRPHLFGLQDNAFSPGSQRTATLVARVMSAMSFFTPRDAPRDPELALFADVIRFNSDMMLDYLSTLASGSKTGRKDHSSPRSCYSTSGTYDPRGDRSELIPLPTSAGPVDLQAELAILSSTIHHRRSTGYPRRSTSGDETNHHMENLLSDLDENLADLHGEYPILSPLDTITTPITPPSIRYRQLAPSTPTEYLLPLPNSANRPSNERSRMEDDRAFPVPPSPFGVTREKSQKLRRDLTENIIKRSLSTKGVMRRGSLPGLKIKPAGKEADENGRPKTARR